MQEEFSAEIDPESMADTAAAYLRASSEADDAGKLAATASRDARDAGEIEGEPLVDADGNIRMTTGELDASGMEGVVRGIERAMNLAIDAERAVRHLIRDQVAEALDDHRHNARVELRDARGALDRVRPDRGNEEIVLSYQGEDYTVVPDMDGFGFAAYSLPQELVELIKSRHLGAAVVSASSFGEEIEEEIESYRRRLVELAHEMGPDAVALTGGPLKILLSPEMAEWAADQFRQEQGRVPPRVAELTRLVATLNTIVMGVWGSSSDDPTDVPEKALRDLTPAERKYLETFYGRSVDISLAYFGRQVFQNEHGIVTEDPPFEGGSGLPVASTLADGILVLTNPEVGGFDVRAVNAKVDPRADVSVVNLVYAPEYLEDPGMGLESGISDLDFGTLMGTATVPPGRSFGEDLLRMSDQVRGAMIHPDSHYLEWQRNQPQPPSLPQSQSQPFTPPELHPTEYVMPPGIYGLQWAASRHPELAHDPQVGLR
ncbi:hypothetical protein [Streptomyces sp. NPDC049881]|uniref:hypothetical protein n=1 Tax=Streptomyces sp. NPDC049881 TaxID=3155778 RepID=UPI0034349F40